MLYVYMGVQFLTPQTPRRKSRYAILINQSTNQPPLWGANTYIFAEKLWAMLLRCSPPRTACFISELTVEPLQAVFACISHANAF